MSTPIDATAAARYEADAAALHALYRRLDVPGIIDVHTHFMPERVMRKVWAYFDRAEEGLGMAWPITYRHEDSERVELLRRFGVLRFSSLLYPHKPEMAEWLNGWAAAFAADVPDCVHSATFYPEPSAATYVPRLVDEGARIFKAHVQVGAYDPEDALLEPVWGTLEDAGTPVVVHAGSGPEPGPCTGPEPIAGVLSRFPRLRLVIAHMGMPEYAEFLALAAQYENVHLDTTMNFTDYTEQMHPFPPELRPRLVELGEKIVFGSDFPNIPYSFRHAVEAIDRLGLGQEWTAGVLYRNPARLLGIDF